MHLHPVAIDTATYLKPGYAPIVQSVPTVSKKLGLSDLKSGVDSFEIRFWLPNRKGEEQIRVLSIGYTNNSWFSKLVSFNLKYPESYEDQTERFAKIEPCNVINEVVLPGISIEALIDSINILNLQNAPSNLVLNKGQNLAGAPTRYMIEIADRNNYRIIHCYQAERENGAIEFDKKIDALLNFLKRYYQIEFS
ncbi:MAG: hypothetical protein EOP48_03960 [Sphingobacteriales bacterium]|nr:MAG: hypothetical protein EOP48_03960 [Sphingobacteriales bacterium]